MSFSPENHDLPPSKPAAVELTKEQKSFQTLSGFAGFYVVNLIMLSAWIIEAGRRLTTFPYAPQDNSIFPYLPILVNVGALIIFSRIKSTRRVAFGILVAIAVTLAFSLIVGIFINVVCFAPKGYQ